jgi:hypothetical protein
MKEQEGVWMLIPFALVMSGGFLGLAAAAAESDRVTLDQALKEKAPVIRDALVKKYAARLEKTGQLSVGVLTFLVQKGKDKPSANAGPLNLRLADRLEVALILALKVSRLRILHDASGTVVRQMNRRANHLDSKGRKAFFDNRYSPAWGGKEETLSADVFLTGRVHADEQFHTATVTVEAFDDSGVLHKVCTFTAQLDPRTLTEAGVSFRDRGVLGLGGRKWPAQPEKADKVQKEMPIAFTVLYDGKEVPVKNAAVPEPREDQKVSFRLSHRNRDKQRYGVVLAVNGDNTIFPEQKATDLAHSWKWILGPGDRIEVRGFQVGQKNTRQFTVVPSRAEDASRVRYHPHAGSFQVVIFRERRADDKDPDGAIKPNAVEAAIARGVVDMRAKKATLKSLQAHLKKTPPPGRGYIEAGSEAEDRVKVIDFTPWEHPVFSLTVRYYTPPKE